MTKETILQTFGFYTAATDSERRAISDPATVVSLVAGESFYRQGEVSDHFGLVARGNIRVFKTASNGREVTLYHVRDGEPCLINMLCVFLDRAAMASAVVEAPTDAVLMPAITFRKLLTTSEILRRFVFETMAERLVDVMMLVEEIAVRRMDARLASWLLRAFSAQRPDTVIAMTHDDLAAELGTAREVVSRVLKEFERRGAVRLARARIVLVDEGVLSSVAPPHGG